MEINKRNRAATTQRIVDALEQILTQDGLDGVSVNALSEKAAVSKVLIYRYFNSLDGLLEYYVRQGHVVPQHAPAWLKQIQPTQPRDLAPLWSSQALQLFRQFRTSRAARELLKATVKENNVLAETISRSLDGELTRLVNQLTFFIKGGDHQAISAVILGALSYLTIQAQLDRQVIGLDLRSEAGWQRIEEAINMIYKALNQSVIDSPTIQLALKESPVAVSNW